LLMTNDTHQIPVEFTGSIDNERPVYQGTTGIDGNITLSKTGELFGRPSDGLLFECLNGSGDTSLNTKEIQWEIISAVVTDGEAKPRPSDYAPNGVGVVWPTGYFSLQNKPSTIPSYSVYEGQDLIALFKFADAQQDYSQIRDFYATFLRFTGLQNVGQPFVNNYLNTDAGSSFIAQLFGADNVSPETSVLQTPQLVNFIEFNLVLQAKDRSGSGQVAESSGLDSSIIQIKVRAEN